MRATVIFQKALIIAELLENDTAEVWMEYLKELVKWMGNSEEEKILAGLSSLIIIYEKADDTIFPLSAKLLLSLCQIFTM